MYVCVSTVHWHFALGPGHPLSSTFLNRGRLLSPSDWCRNHVLLSIHGTEKMQINLRQTNAPGWAYLSVFLRHCFCRQRPNKDDSDERIEKCKSWLNVSKRPR